MKLASLKDGRAIVTDGARYTPLSSLGFSGSMLEFVQAGETRLEHIKAKLSEVGFLENLELHNLARPIAKPTKVICIGLNYRDHAIESGMAIPSVPVVFTRFNSTLLDPFEDIEHDSSLTSELDYEVELVIVIGKTGKRIAKESAMTHVLGYSVCNDVSARDLQMGKDTSGQWTRGKNVDATCPIGPWIVTKDEISDPQNLKLGCTVNGISLQNSSTSEMIFGVEELVHRLSFWFTLEAGDTIITGTPVGVGFARKPPIFLKPGDVTKVWVEGIGEIENKIVEVNA
jgi:2-keto-4-pentenoate hydratase/2-oxohepta-3-ene-1,7-dioic acid hydratase in catechol pathway